MYFILFLSALIDTIGFGIVIPLVPFYALKFGASPTVVTLLFSIYALMQFIFAPLWGIMSDRFGRRPMLLLSLIGSSFAYLWLSYASSLWILFACRALEGVMAGSLLLARVCISDITTKENRAKGMTVIGTAFGVGLCLGPAISSILVGSNPQNPNLMLPPLFAAGMSLVGFIIGFFALPESKPGRNSASTQANHSPLSLIKFTELLQTPPMVWLILSLFLNTFVLVGTSAILGIWCQQQLSLSPQEIGYVYMFSGLVSVVVQAGLVERLSKRFGEANLLFGGLVISSFGSFLIPFSTTIPLVLAAIALNRSGNFLGLPLLSSLISQAAGARQQGKILGFAESVSALARIAGPVATGLVFGIFGPSWSFWIFTIAMLLASIFGWQVAKNSRLSSAMSKQRKRKMKRMFDMLDYNKNGVIESTDFEQVVNVITELRGLPFSSPDYWVIHSFWIGFGDNLKNLMDADGDGKITLDEWLEYMGRRLDRDFADSFMKLIDSNQDGEASLNELKTFYQAYKIDTHQTAAAFEKLDINGDGTISSEEMREMLAQFMYSDELNESGNLFLGV